MQCNYQFWTHSPTPFHFSCRLIFPTCRFSDVVFEKVPKINWIIRRSTPKGIHQCSLNCRLQLHLAADCRLKGLIFCGKWTLFPPVCSTFQRPARDFVRNYIFQPAELSGKLIFSILSLPRATTQHTCAKLNAQTLREIGTTCVRIRVIKLIYCFELFGNFWI